MAGGKRLSRTFVKRTLVGEKGITYKYLGLRIFAHSWGPQNVSSVFSQVYQLNQQMIERTKVATKSCANEKKSCEYNLTLINYMEPVSKRDLGLKSDPTYGMGLVSVSWHADSSLMDYSTIGVYHCIPEKKKHCDWKIALRISPDVENADKVLPVVVPTKDGDAYYLAGDFNHYHQHMVLAGTSARISSTHRVAVEEKDTFEYIYNKVKTACKLSSSTADHVRQKCLALVEVESEWICQYWVQGNGHDELHIDWQKPIRLLEKFWLVLEKQINQVYELCILGRVSDKKMKNVLLTELKVKQGMRREWDRRRKDKAYKRIEKLFRPVERPIFTDEMGIISKYAEKEIQRLQTKKT